MARPPDPFEVLDDGVVDREVGGDGSVLGAEVGDRRPVTDREEADTGPKELDNRVFAVNPIIKPVAGGGGVARPEMTSYVSNTSFTYVSLSSRYC